MKEVRRQAKDNRDNALSFEGKVLKGYYVRPYANGAQKSKVRARNCDSLVANATKN